jgi:serine/threonine protein kinase
MATDADKGSSDNDDDGGVVSSSNPVDRRSSEPVNCHKGGHSHHIRMASIFNFVYPNNIVEKYKLGTVLGQGTFGVVRLCENIETKEKFALKTILKSKVPDVDLLKSEIEILSEIDHPHIIKLFDVFEDVINVYLITELCTGGELYDRVVAKTNSPEGHFSEFDAARILRNILLGIRYCHEEKHIVHRDLVREVKLYVQSGLSPQKARLFLFPPQRKLKR